MVISIGYYCFDGCRSLISVTIGNNVTKIGRYVFGNCDSLTNITVASKNKNYSSKDGVLFNKNQTTLIRYPSRNSITSYIIPKSVINIECGAFGGCERLTSVTIPNSVTSIGDNAFNCCKKIKSISIPNSVTSIGSWAFSWTGLTNVTIPSSVTSIGVGIFGDCHNLISITLSNSITSIRDNAFEYCTSLTNIIIPNSVTSIGLFAFDQCNSLKDIYYTGTKKAWDKIAIESGNICLTNATIHYNSTSPNLVKTQTFNSHFSNDIISNYNYINSTQGPAGPLMDDAWDINKLANGFVQSINHWGNGKTTEENIQEFYDAVLYDLIANTYSLPNFDSYMQKRFNKIQKDMIEYFISKGFDIFSTSSKPDSQKLLDNVKEFVADFAGANQDEYKFTYEIINSVTKGVKDGTECVEKLSQYMMLKEEGSKLEGALRLMQQNAENSTLKKALGDVINSLSMTPQEYMNYVVAAKMEEYGLSTAEKLATKIFEKIIVKGYKAVFGKVLPLDEIKLLADIVYSLGDTFFANTTNSDQQYRLYIYIQVENSCKKSITSAKNTYQSDKLESNAATLVSCYDMYLRIYEHEITECLNLADIYYNQGVFNKVKNKLFNGGKNYQNAVDWINSYNYDLGKLQDLEQNSYEKWGLEKGIIKKVYVFVMVNDNVVSYNDFNINTGSKFSIPSMQGVINTLKKSTGYDVVTNGNYFDRNLTDKIIGGSFKVNNNTAVFVDLDLVKRKLTKATTKNDGNEITIDALTNKQLYKRTIPKVNNIKLNSTSYTYSGKMITPKVTVKNSKGYTLKEKTDYTLSYSSGRKKVGKYTITIKFKGNYNGTVKKTFTIVPKSTTVSKVTAGKKAFTVKWKKQTSQTTGYQIQYSTDKNFKKNNKNVTISKNKTTSKKVSKLKAKKKYYVRIRTYKTVKVNGKSTKVYSSWSKAKTVKTK